MSHRVNGVTFDTAVLTQLSREHLDYHKDMEAYADAKAQLFRRNDLQHAVLNLDDELGCRLIAECKDKSDVLSYSLENMDASLCVIDLKTVPQGFDVSVTTPWGHGTFTTSLLGRFNISNLLAVLGVLGCFGFPLEKLLASLESLKPIAGRMQTFGTESQPAVIVDYSHTPDALEKALQALQEHCTGKLWCVFGCGGDRDRGKRPQMAKAAELFSDYIVVTNDNPRKESPEQIADDIMAGFSRPNDAKLLLDRAEAIAYAIQSADQQDYILIAGKGHETHQIIGEKSHAFSDAEQVRAQLMKRTD